LVIAPNRAAVRNRISVALTKRGRPVDGAQVTLTFSMPAMNMWNAFALQLAPSGDGAYSATEPVVGMTGLWQVRARATLAGASTFTFTVIDRVGA
jgi:hypothetical protein